MRNDLTDAQKDWLAAHPAKAIPRVERAGPRD